MNALNPETSSNSQSSGVRMVSVQMLKSVLKSLRADMQKHPSSLAVLAEDLRKLAEIHKS